MVSAVLALGMLTATHHAAHAITKDMRVLVVSTGSAGEDPGRDLIEGLLDQMNTPYHVLDSSVEQLTASMLYSGTHGYYNGIILTQSDTYIGVGQTGLDLYEFQLLHEYERDFDVREAVLSGFPTTNAALDLDYGMGAVTWVSSLEGQWQSPAGGPEHYEYINTSNPLSIRGSAFLAVPINDPAGPMVTPLMVDAADPQYAVISLVQYADGREVLLSTIDNAWYLLHSQVLAYEFVNFATGGLLLGARHAYLSVHNDDMFLADEVWNPVTNTNWPEDVYSYRMNAHDVENFVAAEAAFQAAHPLFSDLRTEFSFNGSGADSTPPTGDPQNLSQAMIYHKDSLHFINHTYGALQMDRLCPDPDEPQPDECPVTDYTTVNAEIAQNRTVWQNMGFPQYQENLTVLLADSHSGLHDRNSTPEDPSDDIVFPDGANPNFLQAAVDLGVQCIASDASQPNQDEIQWIHDHDLVMLPRYPTAIFYNVTTPQENESMYNWLFHYRYIDAGLDPCTTAGAVCSPRTWAEILAVEAEVTLRHMLSYKPFPHYVHQSNLRDYDGEGSTLQYDWLEPVAALYEQIFTLPVRSPLFHEANLIARQWLHQRDSQVEGYVDSETGEITVWADTNVQVAVTGVEGGELYGGQYISYLDVTTTPQAFPTDSCTSL